MGISSRTKLAGALSGLALFLVAPAGVSTADPNLDPIINTTCSYPQVVGALNAQNPGAAAEFNGSPLAQSYLRQFLAAPPGQRRQMAQQAMAMPEAGQYFGVVAQLAGTCNNY